LQAAKEAIKNGQSVVSDNTNPSVAARKVFVQIATKAGNKKCLNYIKLI
jgi:predicted kinase